MAYVDPGLALDRLDVIDAEASGAVEERALETTLDAFRGSQAPGGRRPEAYNSGAFHGVVAVARAVMRRLRRTDDTAPTQIIDRKCQEIASSLLDFDFDTPAAVLRMPVEDKEGIDRALVDAYMAGVASTLEGITNTVRARLQRRVTAMLSLPERDESTNRLATLLYVALTNYPASRIANTLGPDYAPRIEFERDHGTVVDAIRRDNPPLAITPDGSDAIRSLLLDSAA